MSDRAGPLIDRVRALLPYVCRARNIAADRVHSLLAPSSARARYSTVRASCSARSYGSNGASTDVNSLLLQKRHPIASDAHWQTGARVVHSACGSTIAVPRPGLALLWTLQRRRVGTHDTKPTMRGPWGVPYRPWTRVRDDLVTFWAGSRWPI